MKKSAIGIIFVFIMLASCTTDSGMISDMRCEYLKSPIHIDAQNPRFTWVYKSTNSNDTQKAYKLDLAVSKKAMEDKQFFWTSGKITDNVSQAVCKSEKALESQTKYYWRITSWNENDKEMVSVIDSFEIAKIKTTDWIAEWITDKNDKTFGPAPMFRKTFHLKKEVESARIYISAAAYYKLYVNGEIPNREKLDPGYTHYDKRNLYTTIDITKSLREGENVVATVLGNGFYNEDAPVATWDFEKARWRDRAKMIAEVYVRYTDGTNLVIPTDDTWKTSIGPVWDAALFIIPDALERYYGDTRAIHTVYNTCENYLNYLRNREDNDGTVTYGIGDWVYYHTQTPTDYTTTCFYYWDHVLMTRFAEITAHSSAPYKKKAESLKALIHQKYFNRETGLYANRSQTAQAVALAFGLVPEESELKVAENLNKMIVENNYYLDFGVLGSKYVPRMLSKYGYGETAYKMAIQETAPSWGNWMKLGFTTLAETWVLSPEFRDASVNHVFLGDISAWMVNTLAGINYNTECRGFEKIIIKPDYIGDLSWVKGEYKSVKGLIKSEWRRDDDDIRLSVTIPVNTTATIYTDKVVEVGGGSYEFVFKYNENQD
jgi:hypothetical protein